MSHSTTLDAAERIDPLAQHILSLPRERRLSILADLGSTVLEQARALCGPAAEPVAAEVETPAAPAPEVEAQAAPAAHPQRRRSERRRTLKSGRVLYNNMQASIDCDIREFSNEGCRIRVVNPMSVPERFVLEAVADGAQRNVRVVWRSPTEIGLAFV